MLSERTRVLPNFICSRYWPTYKSTWYWSSEQLPSTFNSYWCWSSEKLPTLHSYWSGQVRSYLPFIATDAGQVRNRLPLRAIGIGQVSSYLPLRTLDTSQVSSYLHLRTLDSGQVSSYLPLRAVGTATVLQAGPAGTLWSLTSLILLGVDGAVIASSLSLSDTVWKGSWPKLSRISLVRSSASSAASLCCWPSAKANGLAPKLAFTLVACNEKMAKSLRS